MRLEHARVIIIDDHDDLVDNLREILEDEGAIVHTAASAATGIEVASRPFDVALVDVRLPDARGPELIPRLRGGEGIQEVVLVTGHASIRDAVEAVKAGAFDYVLKPFDPDELVGTVELALDRVRLRRRAAHLQTALEQREAALSTLVDTVQALLLVLSEDCVVLQANPAVAFATGIELPEIIGKDWVESFVPLRERELVRDMCQTLKAHRNGTSLDATVLRLHADGTVEERSVSWRLSVLQVDGRSRIYASGLDVTDIRNLEQRTRIAEKLAAVGTISAGLAHEIRNPLNAAGLQLQLLERRVSKLSDDPRLLEPIETVRCEISRLGRLVSEFLAFARPQALNLSSTDIGEVVTQVAALVRPLSESRSITFDVRVPKRKIVVEADSERLKQVLLNLLRNAMDAVSDEELFTEHIGGRVELRLEPDGAGACIRVRDNGPGVAPEIQARIFEPFFTTKEEGTGLGMAIAHKIVDLHGGEIRLVSESGEGACFTISLPQRAPMPLRV